MLVGVFSKRENESKQDSTSGLGMKVAHFSVAFWVVVFAVAVAQNYAVTGDPLIHMIPNFLLFTPFRATAKWFWGKVLVYDKEEKGITPIPEIPAANYTFEKLSEITDGFKHPAVVRGMFSDTDAVKKWSKPGYLSQYLGDYEIPVIQKAVYGTEQKDREVMTFRESYEEVLVNKTSMKYLFFPVKSRVAFNHSKIGLKKDLSKAVNEIALQDLDLDRIWPGYGTDKHTSYHGAQIIAGQGGKNKDKTGTNWHCAPGNNWFVQVAGRKRWYFMDQEYSSYMQPQRGGLNNMWTSAGLKMSELQKFLPTKFVDLETGDMLYNPDFEWHTIHNYEGLSIGVPMREVNRTLTKRNNAQFFTIVMINGILNNLFGITYGFGKG